MILAATGHRPNKLGYGNYVIQALQRMAHGHLLRLNPAIAISGLAVGWDTAFALAAINANIPLVAAVPFAGQEQRWPSSDQVVYRYILSRAVRVEIISPASFLPRSTRREIVGWSTTPIICSLSGMERLVVRGTASLMLRKLAVPLITSGTSGKTPLAPRSELYYKLCAHGALPCQLSTIVERVTPL